MKKILITSTDLMMIQFLVPHVKYLAQNGFHVELACSEVGGRMADVRDAVAGSARAIHTLRLERSPVSPRNFLGYGDLKRLLRQNRYDVIWTNEPVMGVVTRLAANRYRKSGTKVAYMCHGFHFYKGSGKLNWLIYYPVERLMARLCDRIITINREDEQRAGTFACRDVVRIDGIGVNLQRLQCSCTAEDMRARLGIPEDAVMVVSVGELQHRKNHAVILRALAQLKNPAVQYVICGRGALLEQLQTLARQLGIGQQVHFLGYRRDIPDIMNAADIYAHPSAREGLGIACLEAMAFGLPLVTSNIQGIPDYVENGVTGFLCDPQDVQRFAEHLQRLIADPKLRARIGATNLQRVKKYDVTQICPVVRKLMDWEDSV